MPPAARGRAEGEAAQLRRRVTGLINRLSDPNLPQVGGELLSVLDTESRRAVTDIITELLLEVSNPSHVEHATHVWHAGPKSQRKRSDV